MTFPMVDLKGQYIAIKDEIDTKIQSIIDSTKFIGGQEVKSFEKALSDYLSVNHVISCANGTDAIQIALMALELNPGDEVIMPSFTYAAVAEAAILVGLKPVFVDVDYHSFNLDINKIEECISPRSKVIIPVHLFGQGADMESILAVAKKHNLYIIEDNAQSIGAEFFFQNKEKKKLGTIGDISCTSFFPSKNLGCYGDGGAMMTNNKELAERIRMIANHGQKLKYNHDIIGMNSRLDAIQAGILSIKLKYLDRYIQKRQTSADLYDVLLSNVDRIQRPFRSESTSHVFHQYTLKVEANKRNQLQEYLKNEGVASMIYYPRSLHQQRAYAGAETRGNLENSEKLQKEVLSLPMHTELTEETISFICNRIENFYS